jgi:hypothetical protein
VITEYDESWGSVVSADQIKNQLSGVYTQIKDLLVDPTANIVALQNKIKDLRAARADLANADFTAEYKAEQLAALDAAISGMVCLVGEPPATGSRMSAALNSKTCDASSVGASIDAAKAAGECKNPYKGNCEVFDMNGRVVAESNSNGKYIVIKYQKGTCTGADFKYRLLSEYYDDIKGITPINPAPFVKVMQHFAGPLGINIPVGIKTKIQTEKNGDAVMFFESHPTNSIYLAINASNNEIPKENNYVGDFNSSLVHEYNHYLHFLAGIDDEIPINHADVCVEQIKHATFSKVQANYSKHIFNLVVEYVNKQASLPGIAEIDVDRKVIEYNKIFKIYNY